MPEKNPPYKPVAPYKPAYKPMESISYIDYIKEKNSGIKPFGIVHKAPNENNVIAAQGLKFPSGYNMLGYGVIPTRKNPHFKGVLGGKGYIPVGENTSISLGGEGAIGKGNFSPRIGFTHKFDNGGKKVTIGDKTYDTDSEEYRKLYAEGNIKPELYDENTGESVYGFGVLPEFSVNTMSDDTRARLLENLKNPDQGYQIENPQNIQEWASNAFKKERPTPEHLKPQMYEGEYHSPMNIKFHKKHGRFPWQKTLKQAIVDPIHKGLDVAGMTPGAGIIPDLINAGLYGIEGDWENMGYSSSAAVPLAGLFATPAKYVKKGLKYADQAAGKKLSSVFGNQGAKKYNEAFYDDLIHGANQKLNKGLNIKKQPYDIKLEKELITQGPGVRPYGALGVKMKFPGTEDYINTGSLAFDPVVTQPRTLTDIITGKRKYNLTDNWGGATGFTNEGLSKSMDEPFYKIMGPNINEATNVQLSTKAGAEDFPLMGEGLSGEINEAINQTLKDKGLTLFSGTTGHSMEGAKRYRKLLESGKVKPIDINSETKQLLKELEINKKQEVPFPSASSSDFEKEAREAMKSMDNTFKTRDNIDNIISADDYFPVFQYKKYGGSKYPSGPYYPYKGDTLKVNKNYDKTHVQPLPFKYGGCRRYDFGSTMRSVGAGAYGVGEGLLDTLTLGATDTLTDKGYDKLSTMGKDRTQEEIERDKMIRGFSNTAGAIGGAVLTGGATTGAAISEGSEGLAEGVTNIKGTGEEFDKWANLAGQVGSVAGGFVGGGGGGELGGALEGSQGAQNLMNYGQSGGNIMSFFPQTSAYGGSLKQNTMRKRKYPTGGDLFKRYYVGTPTYHRDPESGHSYYRPDYQQLNRGDYSEEEFSTDFSRIQELSNVYKEQDALVRAKFDELYGDKLTAQQSLYDELGYIPKGKELTDYMSEADVTKLAPEYYSTLEELQGLTSKYGITYDNLSGNKEKSGDRHYGFRNYSFDPNTYMAEFEQDPSTAINQDYVTRDIYMGGGRQYYDPALETMVTEPSNTQQTSLVSSGNQRFPQPTNVYNNQGQLLELGDEGYMDETGQPFMRYDENMGIFSPTEKRITAEEDPYNIQQRRTGGFPTEPDYTSFLNNPGGNDFFINKYNQRETQLPVDNRDPKLAKIQDRNRFNSYTAKFPTTGTNADMGNIDYSYTPRNFLFDVTHPASQSKARVNYARGGYLNQYPEGGWLTDWFRKMREQKKYKGKTEDEILEAEKQKRIAQNKEKPFYTTNLESVSKEMMDRFTIPQSGPMLEMVEDKSGNMVETWTDEPFHTYQENTPVGMNLVEEIWKEGLDLSDKRSHEYAHRDYAPMYDKEGNITKYKRKKIQDTQPWSAATISYLITKAGLTPENLKKAGFNKKAFRPHAGHWKYITDALRTTNDPKYKHNAYSADNLTNFTGELQIGDILFTGREGAKNWSYDRLMEQALKKGNKNNYNSHTDVIVSHPQFDENGDMFYYVAGGNTGGKGGWDTYTNRKKVYFDENGKYVKSVNVNAKGKESIDTRGYKGVMVMNPNLRYQPGTIEEFSPETEGEILEKYTQRQRGEDAIQNYEDKKRKNKKEKKEKNGQETVSAEAVLASPLANTVPGLEIMASGTNNVDINQATGTKDTEGIPEFQYAPINAGPVNPLKLMAEEDLALQSPPATPVQTRPVDNIQIAPQNLSVASVPQVQNPVQNPVQNQTPVQAQNQPVNNFQVASNNPPVQGAKVGMSTASNQGQNMAIPNMGIPRTTQDAMNYQTYGAFENMMQPDNSMKDPTNPNNQAIEKAEVAQQNMQPNLQLFNDIQNQRQGDFYDNLYREMQQGMFSRYGGLKKFEHGGPHGETAKEMIMRHEGTGEGTRFKVREDGLLEVYADTKGLPTVGYGHLITKDSPEDIRNLKVGDTISKERAKKLFNIDYDDHAAAALKIPGYDKAPEQLQNAMIDLTFNMGPNWYKGFPSFVKAVGKQDWKEAGLQLKYADPHATKPTYSDYWNDTKTRAEDVVGMFENYKVTETREDINTGTNQIDSPYNFMDSYMPAKPEDHLVPNLGPTYPFPNLPPTNNNAMGGYMQYANGGQFDTGGQMGEFSSVPTTEFNNGGSHEENPHEGIPQGPIDRVEEGELKITIPGTEEQFIVSPKIKLDKTTAEEFDLPKKYVGKDMVKIFKSILRKDVFNQREGDTIDEHTKELEIMPYVEAHALLTEKKNAEEEAKKQEEFAEDMGEMVEKYPEYMQALMAQQQPQGPSPEEQAMMEQQMMAQQQGGMPQGQPSPEEMAMMQQQGPPQGMPMMTYGGGLSQPIKFMSYPQNEMIMANGGQPSGASQGEQQQQIMSAVAQALQQGMAPEEVMGKLVKMGIPEQQAGQLIQGVMAQMSPEGQGQAPQQRRTGGHIYPNGGFPDLTGTDFFNTGYGELGGGSANTLNPNSIVPPGGGNNVVNTGGFNQAKDFNIEQTGLGFAASAAPIALNTYQALKKPDYLNADDYYGDLKPVEAGKVNINPALRGMRQTTTAGMKGLQNVSGGGGGASYQANLGNLVNQGNLQESQLHMQKENQDLRSQLQADIANQRLGMQTAQGKLGIDQLNMQADAARFASAGEAATQGADLANADIKNQMAMAYLGITSDDFGGDVGYTSYLNKLFN